jgi:hypothetical protein
VKLFGIAAGLLFAATSTATTPTPEGDVLLKAINFAINGKDEKDFVWKSRPECVVVAEHGMPNFHSVEVVYLNNVDASRIRVGPYSLSYQDGHVEHYVKVELHGEATIREYSAEYQGKDLTGQPVQPSHESSTDWAYDRQTIEADRMIRAWKYIYAHGCSSARSSF